MLRMNSLAAHVGLVVLRDSDPADDSTVAHDVQCGPQSWLETDALQHSVGAIAAGQVANSLDTLVATLGDHIGGSELDTDVGTVLVPTHQHDPLSTQTPGGQHRTEPDCPIADDGHRRTRTDSGLDRAMVSCREHVRQVSRDGNSGESSPTGTLTKVPSASGTRTASP